MKGTDENLFLFILIQRYLRGGKIMDNKQLTEKRFLINCGYTIEEATKLIEGFGVTDALPEGPEGHPNVLSPGDGGASPDARALAANQFNQLLSILTNIWRGKVPPQIVTLSSEIKRYFSS